MKTIYVEFEKSLIDLRNYASYLEAEKKVFAKLLEQPTYANARQFSHIETEALSVARLAMSGSVKRLYDYSSITVGLYGIFENYLESILKAYLEKLQSIFVAYSELPSKIRENHVAATSLLLSKPDLQKFRDVVTPEVLTANLHSCLSNSPKYRLNVDAFTYHTANFRSGAIDEFFNRVGIPGMSNAVFRKKSFIDFLAKYAPERKIIKNAHQDLFPELNDLADRRNEVAHGSQVDAILSTPLLLEYSDFIQAYGRAVYEVLEEEYMGVRFEKEGVPVLRCIKVIDNSIVCVEIKRGTSIAVGDLLVAAKKGSGAAVVWGAILEIQLDKLNLKAMSAIEDLCIACKVGYYVKDNYEFRFLEAAAG
jgi:hypothetical protein